MENLIFDRTQADVTYAAELNRKLGRGEALTPQELADWNAGLKGAYNAADMNRVDAAVRELGGMLTAAGYPVRYTSPVLPPEPEYTPLSYIEASGTQYINTGYKPNSNTRVVLSGSGFSLSGNNQGLFGARAAFTEDTFSFLATSSAYRSDYGTANDSVPQGTNLSSYFLLDKNKNVCKINSTVVQSAVQTFTCSYNLYICAINTANTVDRIIDKVKIYYCQIYDDDILVRDFVPAEKNGVIGLYDKAGKKMYGNSGTGDFIAGEVVPQPQPEPQKTEFETGDIITYDIWRIYLANVQSIRDAYYAMPDSPDLPAPTAPLTFDGANAIEKLLYDILRLYDAMIASYRPCGSFKCGSNTQHLPLQRSVI